MSHRMRRIRWTVGRRIAVIAAVCLASTVLVAAMAWFSAGTVEHNADRMRVHDEARSDYQSLEVLATDLMVDGFKSATLTDPTIAQTDFADDRAAVDRVIADLRTLDLDTDDVATIDDVETAFGDYTTREGGFIHAAVAGRTPPVDAIQQANDELGTAVGGAVDALTGDAHQASSALLSAVRVQRTMVIVYTLIGLLVAGLIGWLISRSLVRALTTVVQALQRFAGGDLSHR